MGGVTEDAVPLVTEMLPGVMTPVPLEKIPVRLTVPPSVTIVALAVKLLMVGELPPPPPPPPLPPPPPHAATPTLSKTLNPIATRLHTFPIAPTPSFFIGIRLYPDSPGRIDYASIARRRQRPSCNADRWISDGMASAARSSSNVFRSPNSTLVRGRRSSAIPATPP